MFMIFGVLLPIKVMNTQVKPIIMIIIILPKRATGLMVGFTQVVAIHVRSVLE